MPRKPKTAAKKPAARKRAPRKKKFKVDPAYIAEDGTYTLKGLMFWRWRALDADIQRLALLHAKAKREFDEIVSKHPVLNHLMAERNGAKAQMVGVGQEYADLLKEVSEKTGLDMKTVAIDDKTGRINILKSAEKVAPKKRGSSNSKGVVSKR